MQCSPRHVFSDISRTCLIAFGEENLGMKEIQKGGSQDDLPFLTGLSFALFIYLRRYRRLSNLQNIKDEGLGKTFRF